MEADGSVDEIESKRICFQCVGDLHLCEEIEADGSVGACSYCGDTAPSWEMRELAARIERAFGEHYIRTPVDPTPYQYALLADPDLSHPWERDGTAVEYAIAEAALIPTEAAADVQAILDDKYCLTGKDAFVDGETEFASNSHYEERATNDQVWEAQWRRFERSLKTEARFFSREAMDHLVSVFEAIDELPNERGRRVVLEAGPRRKLKRLWRARVFHSDTMLTEALGRPDLHIGPPPAKAAAAGRMNARGISVFYGATTARVATAEVRPPVGSKVAVATFSILKDLRLLDLTALEGVHDFGSVFDPSLRGRLERASFLQTLGRRLSRPVMPDDEALEYVTTQAIADFLATENKPRFDGIVFASAQVEGGRNVVLFHRAARVEELSLPVGIRINVSERSFHDDGFDVDYHVTEEIPDSAVALGPADLADMFDVLDAIDDSRSPTLRINAESVQVYMIDSVVYRSTVRPVTRSQVKKHDLQF